MARRTVVLLALLVALPQAAAQLNGEYGFLSDFDYGDPLGANPITVVSAAVEASLADAEGNFGFFGTTGMGVDGIERICWQTSGGQGCATGDVRILVDDGGSVGLHLPDGVDGTYAADHVLAMWMDFDQGEDLNTFQIGRTLLAPSVEGHMTFQEIPAIPVQQSQNPLDIDIERTGGLVPLDEGTVIRLDGLETVAGSGCAAPSCTFEGKDLLLSFEGAVSVPAFDVTFGLLPFDDGSTATFLPAAAEAAGEGLRFARINEMLALIEGANAENGGAEVQQVESNEDLEVILQETLAGALLQLPSQGGDLSTDFRLNRFEHLTTTADASGIRTQGTTYFRVADGDVTGAQPLYGFWLFQLPWWGFLLWGAAIGVWTARVVVQPEKRHERWDKYRWVGVVFAVLMALLVFILWDLEMAHVFGTSMFTTEASGSTYWATIGIQLATLSLVFGVVAAPLQILIKNSLLLSKQGTFMGLGTGTGIILSYLLGATLLLSYLDLMLGVVL